MAKANKLPAAQAKALEMLMGEDAEVYVALNSYSIVAGAEDLGRIGLATWSGLNAKGYLQRVPGTSIFGRRFQISAKGRAALAADRK